MNGIFWSGLLCALLAGCVAIGSPELADEKAMDRITVGETTKADIVQNAIDLAKAIGIAEPRVGILSAVETINPAIPSTIDAAALAKMAERGQIKGGLVDGPLAMDNAVDLEAARTKGIHSTVAGRADVLVAPNLEAGNMLAKQLVFLSQADTGGIVVGADTAQPHSSGSGGNTMPPS